MSLIQNRLQRCLNGPYLAVDQSKANQVSGEIAASQKFYDQAVVSFQEGDEATGLKQVWGAMYRAARGLVYRAGYRVEQLQCLEVVMLAHYPDITDEDIAELRRAQELLGPPDAALARARGFMDKIASLS